MSWVFFEYLVEMNLEIYNMGDEPTFVTREIPIFLQCRSTKAYCSIWKEKVEQDIPF